MANQQPGRAANLFSTLNGRQDILDHAEQFGNAAKTAIETNSRRSFTLGVFGPKNTLVSQEGILEIKEALKEHFQGFKMTKGGNLGKNGTKLTPEQVEGFAEEAFQDLQKMGLRERNLGNIIRNNPLKTAAVVGTAAVAAAAIAGLISNSRSNRKQDDVPFEPEGANAGAAAYGQAQPQVVYVPTPVPGNYPYGMQPGAVPSPEEQRMMAAMADRYNDQYLANTEAASVSPEALAAAYYQEPMGMGAPQQQSMGYDTPAMANGYGR